MHEIHKRQIIEKGTSMKGIFQARKNRKKPEISYRLTIEEMTCMHCVGAVKKALEQIGATSVKVDLNEKSAFLYASVDITAQQLKNAVESAGYTVTNISENV